MLRRSITGIVLAVALIILGIVRGWPLRVALVLFMALSIWELYSAFAHRGTRPVRWVGIGYSILVLPVYMVFRTSERWPFALWLLMVVFCIFGFAALVFRGNSDFESAVATVFPIIYPGMMFSMIIPLQDLEEPAFAILALALTFGIALMCDTIAYFVGRKWGRHRLSPSISPKKSIEGAFAGFIAAIAIAVFSAWLLEAITVNVPSMQQYRVDLPPYWHFAIVGALGGIASQIGDLTASMVKRYCGIKDFGSLLPGHGGMMDRIDSVLFNVVIVFFYFMVII